MSNFKFLEQIDSDLYKIIADAEKLYRDEYFEQTIVQTRRFGENICKNLAIFWNIIFNILNHFCLAANVV